jgi:hypothetical protein
VGGESLSLGQNIRSRKALMMLPAQPFQAVPEVFKQASTFSLTLATANNNTRSCIW